MKNNDIRGLIKRIEQYFYPEISGKWTNSKMEHLLSDCKSTIQSLRKRLEISDEHDWDGIKCRDVTIDIQEAGIESQISENERLQQENEKMREALEIIKNGTYIECNDQELARRTIESLTKEKPHE